MTRRGKAVPKEPARDELLAALERRIPTRITRGITVSGAIALPVPTITTTAPEPTAAQKSRDALQAARALGGPPAAAARRDKAEKARAVARTAIQRSKGRGLSTPAAARKYLSGQSGWEDLPSNKQKIRVDSLLRALRRHP